MKAVLRCLTWGPVCCSKRPEPPKSASQSISEAVCEGWEAVCAGLKAVLRCLTWGPVCCSKRLEPPKSASQSISSSSSSSSSPPAASSRVVITSMKSVRLVEAVCLTKLRAYCQFSLSRTCLCRSHSVASCARIVVEIVPSRNFAWQFVKPNFVAMISSSSLYVVSEVISVNALSLLGIKSL